MFLNVLKKYSAELRTNFKKRIYGFVGLKKHETWKTTFNRHFRKNNKYSKS